MVGNSGLNMLRESEDLLTSYQKTQGLLTYPSCLNRISSFDPPPARIFGLRVLELKEQGVAEEEAMAVADVCIWISCP